MCKTHHLKPRFINIPIKGTDKRCQKALEIAVNFRINQEPRFLSKKKTRLNKQPYETHKKCANTWQNNWYLVSNIIHAAQ
jgi:hypothetical protein